MPDPAPTGLCTDSYAASTAARAARDQQVVEDLHIDHWVAAGFKDTLLRWKMNRKWLIGTRRQVSREFKLEAVKQAKGRGVGVAQGARDFDVHVYVLRK